MRYFSKLLGLHVLVYSAIVPASQTHSLEQLPMEMRTIADAARLNLYFAVNEEKHTWALIHVIGNGSSCRLPVDPKTGYPSKEMKFFDLEIGKCPSFFPKEAQMETFIVQTGDWKLVTALNTPAKQDAGKYWWCQKPPSPFVRRTSFDSKDWLERLASPFSDEKGRTILCRLDLSKNDEKQFHPYWSIPTSFEKPLIDAYNFIKQNRSVFEEEIADDLLKERLIALIRGDNPVLAVLAFRKLCEEKVLDLKTRVAKVEAARDPLLRAIFAYILFGQTEDLTMENIDAVVKPLVDNAKNLNDLKSLALAAYTAVTLYPDSEKIRNLGKTIISKISEQVKKKEWQTDEFLKKIFEIIVVDEDDKSEPADAEDKEDNQAATNLPSPVAPKEKSQ